MFQNPILNDLINKYRENKLAHAYLIETNNETLIIEELKKLISYINCPEEYQEKCTKCNLCNLILKNNLPSLKIIEPEGASIKKSQIEELKESFSTIPIYSKYNVYIIKNAEKLNPSSANSMLKFLEEPTEGIIGFFVTSNKDVMLDTIKSRCQSIVIKYAENSILETLGITEDEFKEYCITTKNYIQKINSKQILNHKTELLTKYTERKEIMNIMQIIFQVYYQNFLKMMQMEYDNNLVQIYELSLSKEQIIRKINIITNIIGNLSYNVNMEQALDKFVIEMRDNNE